MVGFFKGGGKYRNTGYVTFSLQVFVFPILQSPSDVAQILWICQLHTARQLLLDNGGSEHPVVSLGWII